MTRNGKDNDTTWINVDQDDMSKATLKAYGDYRDLQALANEARKAFEAEFVKGQRAPAGKRFAFGYKFGKLSVALVDDDRPVKVARPKLTLAEYLAQQR